MWNFLRGKWIFFSLIRKLLYLISNLSIKKKIALWLLEEIFFVFENARGLTSHTAVINAHCKKKASLIFLLFFILLNFVETNTINYFENHQYPLCSHLQITRRPFQLISLRFYTPPLEIPPWTVWVNYISQSVWWSAHRKGGRKNAMSFRCMCVESILMFFPPDNQFYIHIFFIFFRNFKDI